MNKKFTSLLALALCCLTSTSALALEKNDQGAYQIGNAADLTAFAQIVNEGENNANAVLTADIDMTDVERRPLAPTVAVTLAHSTANTTPSTI